MLSALVSYPGWSGPRRFSFPHDLVSIGSANPAADAGHLHLAGDGIRAIHALVTAVDPGVMLSEVPGAGGVDIRVNRRKLAGSTALRDTDIVRIGGFLLQFGHVAVGEPSTREPHVAADPTERALLQAIAAGDQASRIVYADWLEHRGDPIRAEVLHLQNRLTRLGVGDPRRFDCTSRLRQLAAQVDLDWRIRLASVEIERCGLRCSIRSRELSVRCPGQWDALQAAARADIRHCTVCDQDVHYALDVSEARVHLGKGRCVVVDITCGRWHGDLGGVAVSNQTSDAETYADVRAALRGKRFPLENMAATMLWYMLQSGCSAEITPSSFLVPYILSGRSDHYELALAPGIISSLLDGVGLPDTGHAIRRIRRAAPGNGSPVTWDATSLDARYVRFDDFAGRTVFRIRDSEAAVAELGPEVPVVDLLRFVALDRTCPHCGQIPERYRVLRDGSHVCLACGRSVPPT